MAKTYFKIDGFSKYAEVDEFEQGCKPETAVGQEVDIELESDSIEDLLNIVLSYFDVTMEDIEKNACDENGRIDVSLYETANGYKADEYQTNAWKKGKYQLWYAVYTGYIVKITEEEVIL